ncbi:MAG: glycosyltransferase family 4 protein [Proteobacteria bacterium]|nr:glycosyltransferase family 4 protein [Pseudomonadota bacterium]
MKDAVDALPQNLRRPIPERKKMNILIVSIDYPPVPGGISAHVYELSKAFAKAGHRVAVITRRRGDETEHSSEDGWEVYRVALRYMALVYGLQLRNFVKKLLPKFQPDIIHIHGMGPLEWYNIGHIPLAYTNHTSGYLKRIKKGGWRRMFMMKRHFRKVDLFLAPSPELLHVPFPIRAPQRFIANGVDAAKFVHNHDKRRVIRDHLGLGQDDIVAIVTRRLVDKNGVIYLARATQFLQNPEIHFIIIGDGPERAAVQAEFTRHCGKRALFLGNKSHGEIVDYYSAANFSVLPSLMEATSISGLEAMAAGLPLVGTRVGGIPELIKEGINGYLCAPADPVDLAKQINTLLAGDFNTMGHNSRKMVEEQFDWRQIAGKTLEAYRLVLPEGG